MRFTGIGLIVVGAAIAVIGGIGAGDAGGALLATVLGGFLFVGGTVFSAGAGIQDAIGRKG